jgi:hypothetical protein
VFPVALFTAKNAKFEQHLFQMFAPQCAFVSAFICVYLRFRNAKATYLRGHLGEHRKGFSNGGEILSELRIVLWYK